MDIEGFAAGMNFDLTDEQEAFRGVVREFANEVVAPRSAEADLEEKLPLDVIKQMGDLGLFGLPFPEEHGGSDADAITVCLALEELGRVDQSVAITLSAALGLAGNLLNRFGTDEQKERWLAPLARGEALGGFGLTEPGAGSDAAEVHTTAGSRAGNGSSTARKRSSRTRGRPISTFNIVAAATEPAGGPHGISTIIVPTDTPGFEAAPSYRKLGWRASDTHELVFRDCRVSQDHLLGQRGRGFSQCLAVLADGRIGVAALSVGLAQGCLDEAVKYALQREAFGRPIGAHQAIQFKIADMHARVETARLATYPRRLAQGSGQGVRRSRIAREARGQRGRGGQRPRGRADPRRVRLHRGLPGRALLPRREGPGDRRGHERDPPVDPGP